MLHCNVIEDPDNFIDWFLTHVPEDHDFGEGEVPMVMELHQWLSEQKDQVSTVRDVIAGLLANPVLYCDTIERLALDAFRDFSIELQTPDDLSEE